MHEYTETFEPAVGFKTGADLCYKCLKCEALIPSFSAENIGCICGNIFVDVEAGRFSAKENEGVRLLRIMSH